MADDGIPEPKPGLVTDAHGGILFIDEIGELDPILLNKLLKVLEDKRVPFESAYYDEENPYVPAYIKNYSATAHLLISFSLVRLHGSRRKSIPLSVRGARKYSLNRFGRKM